MSYPDVYYNLILASVSTVLKDLSAYYPEDESTCKFKADWDGMFDLSTYSQDNAIFHLCSVVTRIGREIKGKQSVEMVIE